VLRRRGRWGFNTTARRCGLRTSRSSLWRIELVGWRRRPARVVKAGIPRGASSVHQDAPARVG
jgi:hypothetical protein